MKQQTNGQNPVAMMGARTPPIFFSHSLIQPKKTGNALEMPTLNV